MRNALYMLVACLVLTGQAIARPLLETVSVTPRTDHTEVALRFSTPPPAPAYTPAVNPMRLVITLDADVPDRTWGTLRGGLVSNVSVSKQNAQCLIEISFQKDPGNFEVVRESSRVLARIYPVSPDTALPVPDFSHSTERDIQSITVRRIAVDAGHGGEDPGASHHGIQEKAIALAVAQQLVDQINHNGRAKAFLTRRGDYFVDLRERPLIAHQYGADLFISIHANAVSRASTQGTEIYYCSLKATSEMAARLANDENAVAETDEEASDLSHTVDFEDLLLRFERRLYWADSRKIAQEMLDRMTTELNTKRRTVQGAKFAVLRHARMPAVLIEVGFVTNRAEAQRLSDPIFQKQVAASIFRSLNRLLPDRETP